MNEMEMRVEAGPEEGVVVVGGSEPEVRPEKPAAIK